ncbi:MAG: DUF6731 family protein [Planctomycetota bacterium]
MPEIKQITFNFFRAAFDGERRTDTRVHAVLKQIARRHDRAKTIGSDSLLLGEYKILDKDKGLWIGQLRRLRPNDRIAEGDETGSFGDVPLSPGKVVTETAHFLVVPKYKTIAFQGSAQEVGWTQLRAYLERFCSEDDRLIMLPVLRTDFSSKLAKLREPKRIDIKVAKPDRWSIVEDPSVRDITENARRFDADYAEIVYGTRKGKSHKLKAATKQFFIDVVKAVQKHPELEETVESLKMTGYAADGRERVELDFVKDRLSVKFKVDMSTIPTVTAWQDRCYVLAREAWDQAGDQVRSSFIQSTSSDSAETP